jgi:hypothetical protein
VKTTGGLYKEDLHFNGAKWVSRDKYVGSKKKSNLRKYNQSRKKPYL